MLTPDEIAEINDLICDLVLYSLNGEFVRGNDTSVTWTYAKSLKDLLVLNAADPEDQSIIDQINCIKSLAPSDCSPVPAYITTETCGMTVTIDSPSVTSGNPCEGFEVRLTIV